MSAPPGYEYDPSRGEYRRIRPRSGTNPSAPPPPIPPKEFEADYVVSPVKETHHGIAAELEGDVDMGRLSLESDKKWESRDSRESPEPRKRRKIRILSLDGGGIRGYSTLLILQELMHQVYVHEHDGAAPSSPADLPRPCDYFDLIGGNGTGGLIALMLGRMRMDVESCKAYYVELTRYVFITDKTVLGVPYGKTLFKASRLEEAIKYCVRESTRFDAEKIIPHSPPRAEGMHHPMAKRSNSWGTRSRSASLDSAASERGRPGYHSSRKKGNPDAPLLDQREGACKTFVTAMLQGSRKGEQPKLLRSYPSPAESSASYKTTIWQAGRATCATASAFKPITIDQVTFLDEGAGRYNPAIQVLDEAHHNEFPDDELAVIVSVGTGKRLGGAEIEDHHWWEGVVSSSLDSFAEAKRRLMRRVDDCERVHRELVDGVDGGRPGLAQRGVATQDYYRFNVEVGVGEFGMNEWNRLAEVSTGTKRYLQQRETAKYVREAARKMVDIEYNCVCDGTKVKFRPSTHTQARKESGDGHYAELPTTRPSPPVRPVKSQPFVHDAGGVAMPSAVMPDLPGGFVADRHGSQPIAHRTSQPQLRHQQGRRGHRATASQPAISMPYGPDDIGSPPPQVLMSPESPPPLPRKEFPDHPVLNGEADMPNPEIRVTSPTTVADDSDQDSDEELYPGYGRRRKLHSSKGRRKKRTGGGGAPPYPMHGVME